jgi:hypothetical protein
MVQQHQQPQPNNARFMDFRIEKGAQYQGVIVLPSFKATIASNDMVKNYFVKIGFKDVVVMGTGRERTAKGTWAGFTQNFKLPAEVKELKKL